MLLPRLIFICGLLFMHFLSQAQDFKLLSEKVVTEFYDNLVALADEYGNSDDQLIFVDVCAEYLNEDAVLINDLVPVGSREYKSKLYPNTLMVNYTKGLLLDNSIIGSKQDAYNQDQWHVCIVRNLQGELNTGDLISNTVYLVYTVNSISKKIVHSKKINRAESHHYIQKKIETPEIKPVDVVITELEVIEDLLGSGRKEEILQYIKDHPTSKHIEKLQERIQKLEELEVFAKLPVSILSLINNMVYVQGGDFYLGCKDTEQGCSEDEKPSVSITVPSFYMSPHEVSQQQWTAIMGYNPSHNSDCEMCPVENVSFVEVESFIKKLNELSLQSYRLPNEVEWEYVAKKGTTGIDIQNIWYKETTNATKSINSKTPNALGIYNMLGNVWEWCNNAHFQYKYYDDWVDGAINSDKKVIRGASYLNSDKYLRITNRLSFDKGKGDKTIGFRLSKNVK